MWLTWIRETLSGKTLDIFQPANPTPPRFALLFLHSYGLETLHDNPVYSRIFAELNLSCVSPHGQHSWWANRICREFDPVMTAERYLLDHVMPFMQGRWQLGPRALGLFGISMGGQGALRLAFKHADRFPVVAGISSALDYHQRYGQGLPLDDMYDSKEQCRQDTAILHVPPYNAPPHIHFCVDPDDEDWYPGNDRLHEKMRALGVEHTTDLTTQAGGHSWEYFNHMAEPVVRFLLAGLTQESRRLL
jgi:enterochelin esterase-like enzyme